MYSIYLNQVWEFGGNVPSVVYQLGYDENMWYNDITSKWRFVWKTWWTMGIRSTFWRHPGSPELNKCCHRFYCCSELCSVEYQVQSFLVILVLSLDVYYFRFQSHENPKSPKSFWTLLGHLRRLGQGSDKEPRMRCPGSIQRLPALPRTHWPRNWTNSLPNTSPLGVKRHRWKPGKRAQRDEPHVKLHWVDTGFILRCITSKYLFIILTINQ